VTPAACSLEVFDEFGAQRTARSIGFPSTRSPANMHTLPGIALGELSTDGIPRNMLIEVKLPVGKDEEHKSGSASVTTVLTTVVVLVVISTALFLAFLFLREKQRRVYAPRTYLDTVHDE
jgi:hypothetical protein